MTLTEASYVAKRMNYLLATWFYAEASHADEIVAGKALDDAFGEVKRLEKLLSRFVDTSAISRINNQAASSSVVVDKKVIDLLEESLRIASLTEGALDITTAPLTDLWRQSERSGAAPLSKEIHDTLSRTGYGNVQINRLHSTVSFLKKGISLDVGSLGKGYILDRMGNFMKSCGIENGLLDAGGNILCWNKEETKIGIRNPLNSEEVLSTILLNNEAVATSSNDERFYRIGGRTYGHLLDPRTGWPVVTDLLSVSVVASKALIADALSTAIFVLGAEKGAEVARKLGASRIVCIRRQNASKPDSLKVEQILL